GQSSLPRLGAGMKASSLGIGPEGAMELTDRSNLRLGFNIFDYSSKKTKHGVNYDAELDLRSLQITYDQYLTGGFHVSPGLLAYNGTSLNASASVPPGQSFSLGGIRYFSSQTNPIAGSGTMSLRESRAVGPFRRRKSASTRQPTSRVQCRGG